MAGRSGSGIVPIHPLRAKASQSTQLIKSDAVSTILKVKVWTNEVVGMKLLEALVDALSGL